MEKVKLDFAETLKDAITIGLKNAASILGCIILWMLTIWIPYLNVGTTIAIFTLPIELSRGKVISPMAIFDPKYRKYMGEFFLVLGLSFIPIAIATALLVIPGIVLIFSWSLAVFLVIDKGINPAEALSASNKATYGNKWVMFFLILIVIIASSIISYIFYQTPVIGWLLAALADILALAVMLALYASFYRQLVGGGNE